MSDRVCLLASLVVAFAVRIPYIATTDFPLNDGGLFAVMSREVANADFRLPLETSYNQDHIPFVYPPLGFYLAAFAHKLTGLDFPALLRLLPLLVGTMTAFPFFFVARSLLPGDAGRIAALVYPLIPAGMMWTLMGGGLTRSLGLLFALSALALALAKRPALAALACALAALSHLEYAIFAGISLLLVIRRLRELLPIGLGAAALIFPWAWLVLSRHGMAPFAAARATTLALPGLEVLSGLLMGFTWEGLFPVIAATAFLGLVLSLIRREWLLPIWLLAILVFLPRSGTTPACVVVALLAGFGLGVLNLPAATRWTLVGALVAYSSYGNYLLFRDHRTPLQPISHAQREAMAWIRSNTPPDTSFLVMSGANHWAADAVAEWFPALTERKSPYTVQGSEWLPKREFFRRTGGAARSGRHTHLWLARPTPHVAETEGEPRASRDRLLWENNEVSVWAVNGPPTKPALPTTPAEPAPSAQRPERRLPGLFRWQIPAQR